jgi:hypothetical protein
VRVLHLAVRSCTGLLCLSALLRRRLAGVVPYCPLFTTAFANGPRTFTATGRVHCTTVTGGVKSGLGQRSRCARIAGLQSFWRGITPPCVVTCLQVIS